MIVNPPAKFHNEKIPKKYRTVSKTVRTGMVRHLRILLTWWLIFGDPAISGVANGSPCDVIVVTDKCHYSRMDDRTTSTLIQRPLFFSRALLLARSDSTCHSVMWSVSCLSVCGRFGQFQETFIFTQKKINKKIMITPNFSNELWVKQGPTQCYQAF